MEEFHHEEVVMGPNIDDHNQAHMIMKGKRTKRQRLSSSPLALTMICSSSSGEEGGRVLSHDSYCCNYSGGGGGVVDRATTTSPTTTSTDDDHDSTEEEEDMANCLILLAQGQARKKVAQLPPPPTVATNYPTTTHSKAAGGFYVYQCKTCDRCFPSFQALGGHRASHKRPKSTTLTEEKRTWAASMEEDDDHQFSHHLHHHNSTALSLQMPNRGGLYGGSSNKSKVHECSICGAEFSSGQALGGHMRRHRTFPVPPTTAAPASASIGSPDHSQQGKKPRNVLQLDLNLPAPEDDHRDPKFPFVPKEQALVLSTSPLVDCHY